MRRSPFRIARGLTRALMIRWGLVGLAMPWGRAYLLEEYSRSTGLRRHELVHLRQIQRDGALLFTLRYLWWLARYGYWKNPYEIEAYSVARLEAQC